MANTTMTGNALFSAALGQSATTAMNHPQSSAAHSPVHAWQSVGSIGTCEPASVYQGQAASPQLPALFFRGDWLDTEMRQAYLEATIEQDIAWQISINRKARAMTQKELAKRCDTQQSGIARLEDPTYGKQSLAMLTKVAHAFDCALQVKLIPYSQLAQETQDTSPEALTVASFSDEQHMIGVAHER